MCKDILLVVLGLAILSQAHGACFSQCGLGSGEDVCQTSQRKCQPLVVRPQSVPKPPQATISVPAPPLQVPLSLNPIGGPCFCRKPVVKPAVLPKPVCNPCYQRRVTSSSNCALNQQNNQEVIENFGVVGGCGGVNSFPGPYPGEFSGPVPGAYGSGYQPYPVPVPETREQLAPADPVSVAIAYNLAKKAQNLKEDFLSFGFRQLPKEVPVQQKRVNNIPEENLYSLNGAIVELKPVATIAKSLDEEAAEQLLDLQEEETVGEAGVRKLSLGEIGYGLAKVEPTATYVNVPPSPFKEVECKDPNFIPGSVTINQVSKNEGVVLPADLPEPCPPERICKYKDISFGNCGCYASRASSSSSRCSEASNVYVQKYGCGCA